MFGNCQEDGVNIFLVFDTRFRCPVLLSREGRAAEQRCLRCIPRGAVIPDKRSADPESRAPRLEGLARRSGVDDVYVSEFVENYPALVLWVPLRGPGKTSERDVLSCNDGTALSFEQNLIRLRLPRILACPVAALYLLRWALWIPGSALRPRKDGAPGHVRSPSPRRVEGEGVVVTRTSADVPDSSFPLRG